MKATVFTKEIVNRSTPFVDIRDFSDLLESIKDRKVVMLGESSHGTKEFYEWRSIISAELIRRYGFNFIAVEGDWPPCQEVNHFIQNESSLGLFATLNHFSRWPTWMWGNMETASFVDWLHDRNLNQSQKVGFHGLDVYSFYESIDEVLKILNHTDPHLAKKAKDYYACLDHYRHDEKAYAKSLFQFPEGCRIQIQQALDEILNRKVSYSDEYFDAVQNALIVKNAESYYRAMIFGDDDSWNVRDHHMMGTLETLFKHYGPNSKGIVWAHNTHVGDYRATDMKVYGQVNLGGLAREKLGEEKVALIGFTTFTGEVIASHAWEGSIEIMDVPPGKQGSLEAILHEAIPLVGHDQYWLNFKKVKDGSPLLDLRGHRAIGVVYDPKHEGRGNYVPTSVAKRYDALIFINQTSALTPLKTNADHHKFPETYPYGGIK